MVGAAAVKNGTVIDERYELVAEIGRGATGVVWRANDRSAELVVAIKLLHPTLLSSRMAERRFFREVAIASSLAHANLVRVNGHGRTPDGLQYLVMELLRGRTLGALLRDEGLLPRSRTIDIVAQVLAAVGAVHGAGMVHRDLKPGNIVLIATADGGDVVKVCDLGLAKPIEDRDGWDGRPPIDDLPSSQGTASVASSQGEICGTPDYMAPEQARGDALDGRADLYAVGVLLYRLLIGQLPFSGSSALAVISHHLATPPPRPRALRPDLDVSPALENLMLRALAKDPAERPSSAEVFRADLLQIERDSRRTDRRVSAGAAASEAETLRRPTLQRSWRRRGRALGPALVAAALAAVTVAARDPASQEPTAASTHAPSPASVPQFPPAPPAEAPSWKPLPTATVAVTPRPPASSRQDRRRTIGHGPHRVRQPAEAGEHPPKVTSAPSAASGWTEGLLSQAEDALIDGRIADACAIAERVASATPAFASVYAFLGRCYMRLGRPGEARHRYRTYLQLSPAAPDAAFVRAMIDAPPR